MIETKFTKIGVALAITLMVGNALAAEKITVVGWGGSLSQAQSKAVEEPFTQSTGISIQSATYNGGLAEIKAQVENNNVVWDVIDGNVTETARGCDEGILTRIDLDKLPPTQEGESAAKDFMDGALQKCGVANYVWSTVFAFDASKFNEAQPQHIVDFFDLTKFPGKRGMRKSATGNLEWALMADGVPIDQVYKVLATSEGVSRAFKKLDEIKDNVVWWEAGAQPPQLLADGEVVMTSAYNGRLFNAIAEEGKPFKIVWDGQIWDFGIYVIPTGSHNSETAQKFIRFATETAQQANMTKYIAYGPVRKSALSLVDKKTEPFLPNTPKNFTHALQSDGDFWADYSDELNERFANWLAR